MSHKPVKKNKTKTLEPYTNWNQTLISKDDEISSLKCQLSDQLVVHVQTERLLSDQIDVYQTLLNDQIETSKLLQTELTEMQTELTEQIKTSKQWQARSESRETYLTNREEVLRVLIKTISSKSLSEGMNAEECKQLLLDVWSNLI